MTADQVELNGQADFDDDSDNELQWAKPKRKWNEKASIEQEDID
jgi:hypothetical protein